VELAVVEMEHKVQLHQLEIQEQLILAVVPVVVETMLMEEQVDQELLLLDTNSKINMYLLVFKINI
jgi:hypothetical protein